MAQTSDYIIIIALAAASLIAYIVVSRRRTAAKLRAEIAARWGKIPLEQYKEEDLEDISSYFTNLKESGEKGHFIDDITWQDLDMDSVFKRVNNTRSTAGEEYLYSLLRNPVCDAEILEERERLVEYFRTHPSERQKLQFLLAKLGKKRYTGISDYFFNDEKKAVLKGSRYKLLLAALLISPLIMIVSFPTGLFLLIAVFAINMTVYYKAKNEMAMYLESMNHIVNLINYSGRIAALDMPGIGKYTGSLREMSRRIRGTSIKSFYQIFYQTQDPFLEYFKVVFLVELIAFESFLKKVFKYRNEIRKLFETVGLLDSMTAVASFRETLPFHTIPELNKCAGPHTAHLDFTEAYHPLIGEPVPNSLAAAKPVLITGSNASGKSTFLKTAAINALFAQTIHTCLAREYSSCFFIIFTSMALRDSLANKESYYIAEIKSLKRVLDSLNDDIPVLCMIDEVLRGTNTIERIAASSEVLGSFSLGNCLCIAATHDIELVSILKDRFDNYHFQEAFRGNDIVFDYRIYPGRSTTRNAIKLLKVMGYSQDIVKSAEQRAESFERKGLWSALGSQA